MTRFDTQERRRRLQTRQLLTPETRSGDMAAVADAMVALHATDPATVYLSAWARMSSGSQTDMADALYVHRRLIRMMGMRRTVFVVSAALAPVVQASSAPAVAATQRRRLVTQLKQAAVAEDVERWLSEVSAGTLAALERRGSAYAVDLVEDEPRLNTVLNLLPDKAYAVPQKVTSRILTILALEGKIIRGRPLGGWRGTRNQWWPTRAWIPGGLGALDEDTARQDLLRQWLRTFGPAPIADIAWWTGWTSRQTHAALEFLDTVEVDLDGGCGLVLADDLDSTPEPEPTAALLPALDPTPMGWFHRDWFLGEHRAALFDRTGNIGPTIFWQGRVVGGWAQRPDGVIRARLLEDIGTAGAVAVDARVAELTTWLGPLRVIPSFRTPLERELADQTGSG